MSVTFKGIVTTSDGDEFTGYVYTYVYAVVDDPNDADDEVPTASFTIG
jgi:hypothetical protein